VFLHSPWCLPIPAGMGSLKGEGLQVTGVVWSSETQG
jgi:hypothetical protein